MLLTERQAAEMLQCDQRVIRRLILSGRLTAIDLGTSRHQFRIDPEALKAILPIGDTPVTLKSTHPRRRCRRSLAPSGATEAFLPSV
jgi:excisionase family DNA binding protein